MAILLSDIGKPVGAEVSRPLKDIRMLGGVEIRNSMPVHCLVRRSESRYSNPELVRC